MLIPEAVELVLQAVVLARNRETFVLDMGEQLKILDVARNLIRLSGFVPEEEIPISFIGLRPGEKLTEELVGEGEVLDAAEVTKIFRVRWSGVLDSSRLLHQVDALINVAGQGRVRDIISHLHQIVPTFSPADTRNAKAVVPVGASLDAPPVRVRPGKDRTLLPMSVAARIATVGKSLREA
jgi:FlaA1/EpsC-like NDP-sugar epimerase